MTVRTLWVTNDLPPRPGGIQQFLGSLLSRLDPAATRVLASPAPGAADHDAGLPYRVDRTRHGPLLPTPGLLADVREAAREHRADVVVFGAAWPLGELAAHLDQPTLALTHGHEAGMVRAGSGRLVRRVARGVDALTVISRYTRALLEPWVADHTRVHDLPPGVDTDVFHPDVDGDRVRARHDIAAGRPLVVCVSRMVARKGQDVLVEAWPRVLARLPDAHLLLAGAGPLARRLRVRVDQLGLAGSVTLADELPWGDLPAYHAAGDLFAMPCRTRLRGLDVEGLGIVYLEAQACGTPVLAGSSGGAPEALVDGATGRVVDGRIPELVASAVAELLSRPERLARMGAAGRGFVVERYAWPAISARLRRILTAVADGA